MNADNNDDNDVDSAEECPEDGATVVDGDGLKDEGNSETKEDSYCISRYISVSHLKENDCENVNELKTNLIEFDKHEYGNQIHEGGIKLKSHICGAHVIGT